MDSAKNLPVAVIGAGPVGLAAAAHLIERGLEPLILEAGPTPAASIEQWRHIRLFSPWQYNIDAAAVRLLDATGWEAPEPTALPTGGELIDDYLTPLASLPAIASRLHTGARVIAVTRLGMDKTAQPEPRHHPVRRPGRARRRRSPRLPGRRRHRRLRHLVHPQPARNLRAARRGRSRRGRTDFLTAARRPRSRP